MTQYVRNNKTISGSLEEEMVMLDIDQGKYFSLNQTAAAIWELIESPADIDEICAQLEEKYDVDREQCITEVSHYIEDMAKLKLIIRIND